MKKLAVAMLFVMGLVLTGCGSSSNKSGNITGNWSASLSGNDVFTFSTSLVDNGNGTVNITNLTFSSNSCFVSGDTETGTFGLSGDFNGNVQGTFGMTVTSGTPSGNVLTLTGTVNGSTISGKWTLTGGSGCQGTGNFTMTRM